jgi:hypothetical protein
MRRSCVLAALLVIFCAACSGDDTDGETPPAKLLACEDTSQDGDAGPDYRDWDCSAVLSACQEAVFFGKEAFVGSADPNMKPYFDDLEVADCVIAALRDQAPARVDFRSENSPITGQVTTTNTIFLLGPGKAVANDYDVADISIHAVSKNRARVKPASYFEGCLALTDDEAKYNCMADWSDGCLEEALSCP